MVTPRHLSFSNLIGGRFTPFRHTCCYQGRLRCEVTDRKTMLTPLVRFWFEQQVADSA